MVAAFTTEDPKLQSISRLNTKSNFGDLNRLDGGDEGGRTPDPQTASLMLYQLSYVPGIPARYVFITKPKLFR
jgi:hypothetical protein